MKVHNESTLPGSFEDGSVTPSFSGAVIPAAVGEDIGCGAQAVRTNWGVHDLFTADPARIVEKIKAIIPCGDEGRWDMSEVDAGVKLAWKSECNPIELVKLIQRHPMLGAGNTISHLGTLGGGDHFIRICLDDDDRVWVVIHTDSRGIGTCMGRYFIDIAGNLGYSDRPTSDLYLRAAKWAHRYAQVNRWLIMNRVVKAMEDATYPTRIHCYGKEAIIDCPHNFIQSEEHQGKKLLVARKGAIKAAEGDMGVVIELQWIYIVRGIGNNDTYQSCHAREVEGSVEIVHSLKGRAHHLLEDWVINI